MSAPITPHAVMSTFAANDRELTFSRAELIANEVTSCATLENAQAMANHEEPGSQRHNDLLAYGSAIAELGDRPRWIKRLRREGDDLWFRAERQRELNAEYAGKAAFRLNREEFSTAADFQSIADAHNRVAQRLEDESMAKQFRAMELEYAEQEAARLLEAAQPYPRLAASRGARVG